MPEQIRLSYDVLVEMLSRLGTFYFDPGVRTFCVIRGAKVIEQGSPSVLVTSIYQDPAYGDKTDDALIILWKEEDQPHLEGYPCTSQSRKKTAMQHKTGAVILPPYTMMPYTFRYGVHHGRDAFSATSWYNYMMRDLDRDGKISNKDKPFTQPAGVNLHGSGTDKGEFSDGCVIWPHRFDFDVLKHARDTGQRDFLVMIISGLDLFAWRTSKASIQLNSWRPSISYGTRNARWVSLLQELLKERGKLVTVDGHWGPKTQEKVEAVLGAGVAQMTPDLWKELENEPE